MHTHSGNCWHSPEYDERLDVCLLHEQPRGECDECPRCEACDQLVDDINLGNTQ